MRMDRLAQVVHGASLVDRHHRFADQFSGAAADHRTAEQHAGLRIHQPLGQPFRAAQRMRAAAGGPRISRDAIGPVQRAWLVPRSSPAQAISGSVKTTAGIVRFPNSDGAQTVSTATLA